MAVEAFAPAKINLTLHVTGQRADGYHLLDSLVVFADVGDRVRAERADGFSLAVDGPMAAGVPTGEGNLVLRAARLSGAPGARLTLTKALPLASGIGGGSSDAAATLRALGDLYGLPLPDGERVLALGADLPICLRPGPQRMRGIGEGVQPLPPLPELAMVLVNPRVEVPTPAVFRALARKDGGPMPDTLPAFADAAALIGFLRGQRNDLEAPARAVAPVIGMVLEALSARQGCGLARMSGSGATCFGLFAGSADADAAARAIAASHPEWWVFPTRFY